MRVITDRHANRRAVANPCRRSARSSDGRARSVRCWRPPLRAPTSARRSHCVPGRRSPRLRLPVQATRAAAPDHLHPHPPVVITGVHDTGDATVFDASRLLAEIPTARPENRQGALDSGAGAVDGARAQLGSDDLEGVPPEAPPPRLRATPSRNPPESRRSRRGATDARGYCEER